jgi:2-dehydro-3-deoxyphosphooctonate aldolase (KDO 8-P synthase)
MSSSVSQGRREQALDLAKAAISLKIAGLFLESHPEPNKALCDGPSALPLHLLEKFLNQLKQIDMIVKKQVDIDIN